MTSRIAHRLLHAQTVVTRTVAGMMSATRAPAPFDADQVRSILIVRLDEIGDVVLNTPVLRETRRRFPHAHITLVVNATARDLMVTCPYIDELLVFNAAAPVVARPVVLPYRAVRFARRYLWPRHFDLALLPRFGADSVYATYLALFSGARWRVGHAETSDARRAALNPGYDRLLTHAVPAGAARHTVERNLDVLRILGLQTDNAAPELWLLPEDERAALELLRRGGWREGDALIAFCPSAGHSPLKQWPVARMALVARQLHDATGAMVVVLGGAGEERLADEFRSALPAAVIDLIGRTTLRQAAAVIRLSRLYVGNDAGPLHMASAVGTPVVAVFGSSDHTRFGPAAPLHTIIRRDVPCHPIHRLDRPDRCTTCVQREQVCLTSIPVPDVVAACLSFVRAPVPLRSMG